MLINVGLNKAQPGNHFQDSNLQSPALETGAFSIRPQKRKVTENFDIDIHDNDITIIELAQAVDLNTYTPACMAKTSDTTTFDWKNAWVYGEIISLWSDNNIEVWSRRGENGGSWESPLEVEVPVVTQDTCMAAMSDTATITEGMIFAGCVPGRDSCQVRQIFGEIFS